MGSWKHGAKGKAGQMLTVAVACLMVLASGAMGEPNSPSTSYNQSTPVVSRLMASQTASFDPNNQDFSVIIYQSLGDQDSIEEAMRKIGVKYALRNRFHPVTAADLDANDVLIVGWNIEAEPNGLSSSILASGITGRIVLSGHDADYHTVAGLEAAERFLIQAITFAVEGQGTALIALGDVWGEPFAYLPDEWGISPQKKADEIISDFTPEGWSSGIFDGLTPQAMSDWGTAYHNVFAEWGSDFIPLEIGETQTDFVTIARAGEYGLSMTKTDNLSEDACVSPGERVTYSIAWNYPSGANKPDIADAFILDTLPPDVNYYSSSPAGMYDAVTHSVMWELGVLRPGDSNAVEVTVTVGDSATGGGYLLNHARLIGEMFLASARERTRVCCPGGEVIYVKWDAQGENNGTSWTDAFTDLKTALEYAATACQKNVWVAQGTYKPGTAWTDTFAVPENVSVYGGFIGYESPTFDLSQRNLDAVRTILSGEISEYERNYYVTTMGNGASLDGLIIRKAGYDGVLGSNSSFRVENCLIEDNGQNGIRCEAGSLAVDGCRIADNGYNGIYAHGGSEGDKVLSVSNTVVLRNASIASEAMFGIRAVGCTTTIVNSVVNANGPQTLSTTGDYYCGISIEAAERQCLVQNCTIAGNRGYGVHLENSPRADVRNCILWGNNLSPGNDGSQHTRHIGIYYSCVMNGTDANDCIYSDPLFTYGDPNFAWHLLPDSPCIDGGDPERSYAGQTDIDGEPRVSGQHVDIGADEAGCGDVWNPLDWDRDGDIDLIQFAVFASAWQARDPQGPPADPNLYAIWDSTVNFEQDYVIDFKDLRVFCDGIQGYPGYFWMACWKPLPLPWPPMAGGANDVNEPELPWDPNEPQWDPIDPNLPGMMLASSPDPSGMVSMDMVADYDPMVEARQLQDAIDFFYKVAAESPDEAAALHEFLKVLEQDLSAIYESEQVYWDTR